MQRNTRVQRAEGSRLSRAINKVFLAWLIWSFSICALAQDTNKDAKVVVAPETAVRGQIVWIRLDKSPTYIEAVKITSEIDENYNTSKTDGSPQLVCVDQSSKQTWIFSCPETGSFYVRAFFYDEQNKKLEHYLSQFSIVDTVPIPPTPPSPTPGPTPFVSEDGIRVLILSEVDERDELPKEQVAIFASTELREFLLNHVVAESDGTPGYRVWDDDYTDAQMQQVSEVWRNAYNAGKEYQKKLNTNHVMLVAGPKGGTAVKLPSSPQEAIDIISKYVP
ncbi:MAG: hypothetical protein KatS3mg087_1031 [Patescibacteria group bacterium]|nr:MAG: hypothetical protein KatS3mg087_1031 [Patescibacteria group bacterium]